MLPIALNHMTAPDLSCEALIDLAAELGCAGVELRNDLPAPLFGGGSAEAVGKRARRAGIRIVGVSQVQPFDAWSETVRGRIEALIAAAEACGAETISLIPRNDGGGPSGRDERLANLRTVLGTVAGLLRGREIVALVEPLGFTTSSLRHKSDVVDVVDSLGAADRIQLVHDTFHHVLAGGGPIFPEHTGIVHISGVAEPELAADEMRDEHRGLVDAGDRLGNVEQIAALIAAGYRGPISFEAFSPAVHRLDDPRAALRRSIGFLSSELTASVA